MVKRRRSERLRSKQNQQPIRTASKKHISKKKNSSKFLSQAFDKKLKTGYDFIIGVDEAGRGPLAGPVSAGACCILNDKLIQELNVNDSKKLKEIERNVAFDLLTDSENIYCTHHEICEKEIDKLNILQASLKAMSCAVTNIVLRLVKMGSCKVLVLVDGTFTFDMEHIANAQVTMKAIPKGDTKSLSIACASVLAKVSRDRIMRRFDVLFPGYGFARHKGYPTKSHMTALNKLGPCKIHRQSYAPVKNCTARRR